MLGPCNPATRPHDGAMADGTGHVAETFDPTEASAYPLWTHDIVRWGDMDSLGHVNNAMFGRFLESGRIAMFADWGWTASQNDHDFVIVRLAIDFRAQLRFPGTVDSGTRVIRVGRSSITLAQALFQDGACAATAEAIVVFIDLRANRSVPLPDDLRARIGR